MKSIARLRRVHVYVCLLIISQIYAMQHVILRMCLVSSLLFVNSDRKIEIDSDTHWMHEVLHFSYCMFFKNTYYTCICFFLSWLSWYSSPKKGRWNWNFRTSVIWIFILYCKRVCYYCNTWWNSRSYFSITLHKMCILKCFLLKKHKG